MIRIITADNTNCDVHVDFIFRHQESNHHRRRLNI